MVSRGGRGGEETGLAEYQGKSLSLAAVVTCLNVLLPCLAGREASGPLKTCCRTHKPAACLSRKRGRCCTAAKISGTTLVFCQPGHRKSRWCGRQAHHRQQCRFRQLRPRLIRVLGRRDSRVKAKAKRRHCRRGPSAASGIAALRCASD